MSNHQSDIYGQEKDSLRDSESAFTMDSDLDSLFAAQDSAMHMSGGDSSSSSHDSPNDWSTLPTPSFWPTESQSGLKDFDLNTMGMTMEDPGMALDFLQQMEMDFNPSMAIDPTALQFSYPVSQDYGVFANDIGTGEAFPFTFNAHPSPSIGSVSSGDDSNSKDRRLSFGSSVSAASPSPAVEPTQAAMPNSISNAADALAERVRQSAGVLLAVPNGNNNNNSAQASQCIRTTSTPQPVIPSPGLCKA
ncbi:hypothetical protein FIBSPDRAFT_950062 [Athelia psychrophila]|uniref:Uncharacterized protein n=1 Tax=Athelia psychrophila TaxID=1759441 RepID=A0A166P2P8_9AGAM|nr:hypothetical protein FIBSPDRAFT_950062 [Fibularhizoctonia sp. CBS 109695]